jgi:D-alanyl-D-alanine carboxypeptidase (penicillin-binding protein 5/6)
MTDYVIAKALKEGSIKPTDQVTISEKAWRMEGSRMFVEVDTKVSVEDLLMGMVVQSGNDATVALAEYVAGSEDAFASLMNHEAAQLGLTGSHFTNATGLPDANHYTTARDIATLVKALIANFPEHYSRYSVRDFTYNNIKQHNRNQLLWQDGAVDGVKTGHTSSAGYCLTASAQRGDMRLISVVLGAETEKDRFSASQTLLNYGFQFFETHRLYEANTPLTEKRIWKGEIKELPLGLAENLYVTIPKEAYQNMQVTMQVSTVIQAPAAKGESFGNIKVTLDDTVVADVPLVALQPVAEANLFGRLVDQVMFSMHSLFE